MENSHETLNPDDSIDPSLNIISHSSYKSCSKSSSLPWFDIRVFYVRISNFIVDNTTPDFLTLNHIPLSPNTLLQVNGTKCSIHSQGVSCLLTRDRMDKKSEEATFVSTDSIRLTGSVKFDVFDKEDLVLSGVLELSNNNGFVSDTKNNTTRKWWMDWESVMSGGTGFFKGKHVAGSESLLPNVEVYVAGCFLGTPIILTKTLQLSFRKKHDKKATLNSIPEYEASECQKDGSEDLDFEVAEYRNYKTESDEDYKELYWRRTDYIEGEDGELSWFNAGVRVGVGIGLGICLGIGIGVGLFVRTYQATSRNFKRRLP